MAASAVLGGVSAGLDFLSGIYGYLASGITAKAAESRASMVRLEAEANATRYSEQAAAFKANQAVGYLKSGVKLTGSPLDILAETARIASANLSAIRANGAAEAQGFVDEAAQARVGGRVALLSGITGGFKDLAKSFYWGDRNTGLSQPRNAQNAGPTAAFDGGQ